jgi:Protein of unknown function (DUF2975)
MKALGKGSIASVIKVGLAIANVILWVTLGAVALAALVLGAAALGLQIGARPIAIDADIAVSADGVRLSGRGPGMLSWPLVGALVLAAGVVIGGALIIVDRLRRLFVNFTSNEPFNRENATHLRVIWIVMLSLELAKYGFALAVGWAIAAYGRPEGVNEVQINPGFDLSTWASILVLIVLAEVLREGARMREDQDLTI